MPSCRNSRKIFVKDLTFDVVHAILGILDPELQLEFDRSLAERHNQGIGGQATKAEVRLDEGKPAGSSPARQANS